MREHARAIATLRVQASQDETQGWPAWAADLRAAADALEGLPALRAEVADYQRRAELYRVDRDYHCDRAIRATAEIEQLRAVVEAARGMSRYLAGYHDAPYCEVCDEPVAHGAAHRPNLVCGRLAAALATLDEHRPPAARWDEPCTRCGTTLRAVNASGGRKRGDCPGGER